MNPRKIIGLDLGSRTCGVAISDGLGMFAHPLSTLYHDNDLGSLQAPLQDIVQENRVLEVALGYPKMMNNDVGERALISEEFKALLEKWFDIEVILIDERLTTAAATKQLISADMSRKKRKKVVDQVAAVHILQSYLDRKRFLKGEE